ncbi:hypothetical protein TI39_contig5972g00001 [Zymoseptoria brevis]|uniref:Uncharacterized protein n=1 Tax=Zymoseptoria brevis TaxID=1047168 RepID=A0A0F4G4R0_9PEZI|nr:hypothetical protein TI39_contig5972g00001 [Zymoseptoria brevis]
MSWHALFCGEQKSVALVEFPDPSFSALSTLPHSTLFHSFPPCTLPPSHSAEMRSNALSNLVQNLVLSIPQPMPPLTIRPTPTHPLHPPQPQHPNPPPPGLAV